MSSTLYNCSIGSILRNLHTKKQNVLRKSFISPVSKALLREQVVKPSVSCRRLKNIQNSILWLLCLSIYYIYIYILYVYTTVYHIYTIYILPAVFFSDHLLYRYNCTHIQALRPVLEIQGRGLRVPHADLSTQSDIHECANTTVCQRYLQISVQGLNYMREECSDHITTCSCNRTRGVFLLWCYSQYCISDCVCVCLVSSKYESLRNFSAGYLVGWLISD